MIFSKSGDSADEKKPSLFERMRRAIRATKDNLVARIETAITGRASIDEDLLEELEGILLGADLGVRATHHVMSRVRELAKRRMIQSPEQLSAAIRDQLLGILELAQKPAISAQGLQVWMAVGVNGTGKTTTVGKLASKLASEGRKVLVCAADTFRAAAIEQLEVWARRSDVEIVKNRSGSDPSAVVHDSLAAALSRAADLVIIDTAGRLHTKGNLMQELEKMKRVASKQVPGAPHEVFLVLDATTGQNGLVQAREFLKSAGVTHLIVTKLDGTAKGGVLFSIAHELRIPVRYVGIGESIEDLVDFSPQAFVDSLFR